MRGEKALEVLEKEESLRRNEEEREKGGERPRRVEWKTTRWGGGGEGWRWKMEEVGGGRSRGKGCGTERAPP